VAPDAGIGAGEPTYAFGNARDIQRERLRTLETLFDPGTIRLLEARGVARGWRCLEVGAGGGSIAAWLCDRVAPDGTVVATDLDTTVLNELSRANLEIRVHDVLEHDLPAGEFDLVHLRLVLAWLQDPHMALQRLIAALKPGGWLVAEEMDFASAAPDPRMGAQASATFERVIDAHNQVLAARHSFDPLYGRRVTGDLADAGLTDGGCEGRVSMWRGGEPGGRIWQLTIAQLREPMIEAGLIEAADVDAALALFADPRMSAMSPVLMAAWGRRP
jgi:SAM-dependent methyltransferase